MGENSNKWKKNRHYSGGSKELQDFVEIETVKTINPSARGAVIKQAGRRGNGIIVAK